MECLQWWESYNCPLCRERRIRLFLHSVMASLKHRILGFVSSLYASSLSNMVALVTCGYWAFKMWFKKLNFKLHFNCCCLVTKSCPTLLQPHGLSPTRILCPWDFPGKNTGVGCRFLLQRSFLTQGLNSCLLHCRHSLSLSYQVSPKWVHACPQRWL